MMSYLIISEVVWLFWTTAALLSMLGSFVCLVGFVLILSIRSYSRFS